MKPGRIKRIYEKTAAMLAAILVFQTGAAPVWGAEPQVTVDETVYGNLDAYGGLTEISVVKALTPNGVLSFTDRGEYTGLVNMSNHTEPEEGEGQVTWDLTDAGNRFYYQGMLDASSAQLPWTFDVSYKLNGRPAKAEELAGADGLVEIHVKAEPNENADPYYQNNMILAVMIPADMENCYSVDAPGSQTQSVGGQTCAVFTALPGENGDFTARIGSECYESTGVLILMIPGTMDALNHIKDIKEVKDTWRDAGTQMYDSMDAMLGAVESMRDGVNTLQSSLLAMERARETVSGNRSAIEQQNDASIEALSAVAKQSSAMVPYFQTARDSARDIQQNLTDLVGTLGRMQTPLQDLDEDLDHVQRGLSRTEDVLPGLESSLMDVITLDTQLQAQEAAILMTLVGFSETSMEGDIDRDAEEYADDQAMAYADAVLEAMGIGPEEESYESQHDAIYQQAFASFKSGYRENAMEQLNQAAGQLENPTDSLMGKADALETLASHSNALRRSAETLLRGLDHSTDEIRDLMAYSDTLIDDVKNMKNTMDLYYPSVQAALTDSEELVNRTTNLLNQTVASMTIIQNTLKASGDDLDQGTREMIAGSLDILEKGLDVLDATGEIRQSSGVMKTTLDHELDKFEEENRFLEMDPEAKKVSFTSAENPEPESLQIILRTDEISMDDPSAEIPDAETAEESTSPFQRMWNVLVRMWNAIVEIFRDR